MSSPGIKPRQSVHQTWFRALPIRSVQPSDQCQTAVDAVLEGSPITGIDADALQHNTNPNLDPPHKYGDIRHVSTDTKLGRFILQSGQTSIIWHQSAMFPTRITCTRVRKETGLAEISKLLMIKMER
ncbi:hypothetical protein D8674_043056 [Pyrus ussuriensis x Pyrus communis]|uniref:Uncharacterized protein n=1 Tax=Pyrus ussuriensis x Pyrus communis TaxID=2448454 RepID=A0A5N5I489_9ROSA|nr:hypothetical protein D8674_043056 [Pyrus ussuriensis x Pyrus communis]